MNIYQSTQVRPYVYFGIHKVTGEIYVGYREFNVQLGIPSTIDLFTYRTSSKIVNPIFDEFDWYVVAEFFSGDDAYDFEQQLIYEHWNNPLLLNQHCTHGQERWKFSRLGEKDSDETRRRKSEARKGEKNPMFGKDRSGENSSFLGRTHSDITKQKISKTKTGVKLSDQARANMREAAKYKAKPSAEVIKKRAEANRGSTRSNETRAKIAAKAAARIRTVCPHCGTSAAPTNYSRWHGDSCKNKPI